MTEHSNLYIKNIAPEVDNSALRDIFMSYGSVLSCRLVRNPKNPTLNSYGFVKMASYQEAASAIEKLNGATLNTSILEVKFAQADAGAPQGNQASSNLKPNDNLYVRNLPTDYTEAEINSLFSNYGAVKEIKLLPTGDVNKGNGALIRMGGVQEASLAQSALNNQMLIAGGQPLQVRFADTAEDKQRKMQKTTTLGQSQRYNAYGQNGQQPAQSQPAYAQKPASQPQQVLVPQAGQPQYQYINGQPQQVLQAAGVPQLVIDPYTGAATLQPATQNGLPGQPPAKPTQPPSDPSQTSLYVRGLPPTADELLLYKKFAEYGAIKNVKILSDETGKCKGVGFVNFKDSNEAQVAIQAMNGQKIEDKELVVSLQTKTRRF